MLSPFIKHENRIYLIVNWHERMSGNETMTIRPLGKRETELWKKNLEDAQIETWAMIDTGRKKQSKRR